ncbi:MAG: ChpI protein, partial [Microthrixaceae bacterium]
MKTAVSIPQDIFEAADRTAKRLGISRSQLYSRAVARFVAEQGSDEVTAKLDELADELASA